MRTDNGTRYLTAEHLIAILQTLPKDARIIGRVCGDLSICDAENGVYKGYIDIHTGAVRHYAVASAPVDTRKLTSEERKGYNDWRTP